MTTRADAIAFLRALRAGDEGAVIYQDVIDHVLAALDAAHEERIKSEHASAQREGDLQRKLGVEVERAESLLSQAATWEARALALDDDRRRALKRADALTLETQTCDEAVQALCEMIVSAREDRDDARNEAAHSFGQLESAIRHAVLGLRRLDGMTGDVRSRNAVVANTGYEIAKALGMGDVGHHPLDALMQRESLARTPKAPLFGGMHTCGACGRQTRDSTAGCDCCDFEDK